MGGRILYCIDLPISELTQVNDTREKFIFPSHFNPKAEI